MSRFNPSLSPSKQRIATFTLSGNPAIRPISLDYATGIWTTNDSISSLGITQPGSKTTVIGVCTNYDTDIIPRELPGLYAMELEYITDNTFYMYSNGTKITSYEHYASHDFSKVSFEKGGLTTVAIDLTPFPLLKEINVRGFGNRGRSGWSYIAIHWTADEGTGFNQHLIVDGRSWQSHYQEQWAKYVPEISVLFLQGIRSMQAMFEGGTKGTWYVHGGSETNSRKFIKLTNMKFTKVEARFDMANGYTLEVFDVGGVN